jgi:ABC-type bacteriocin/lantibiotic exporter with double-glycine peptidase domain
MLTIHLWSSNLTAYFFNHDHLWLHVIVHVILVITPIALILIILKSIYSFVYHTVLVRNIDKFKVISQQRIPLRLNLFIKKYTLPHQVKLALMALLTIPITYAILELPKLIINNAINSENYTLKDTLLELSQINYLLLLCGFYLLALAANGILKFILNWYKGSVSERLIKRLRLVIFSQQRKEAKRSDIKSLSPVLLQEVEPICSFVGDSVVVPLLQGGTALTIIVFMMMQNVVLGAAVLALLPVQLIVIPIFQRKINLLVKQRLIEVRSLNAMISEDDITGANIGHIIIRKSFQRLYLLRMKLFKTKYLMKSINNFIMNLTPFFFYTVGGYLVIENQLSLGALVASLASYKDLASTIRELFIYYQALQDTRTRYVEMIKLVQ